VIVHSRIKVVFYRTNFILESLGGLVIYRFEVFDGISRILSLILYQVIWRNFGDRCYENEKISFFDPFQSCDVHEWDDWAANGSDA
jgi:hypothetical protein